MNEAFLSMLARLARFELTTPWFVAKYSIQLSYSRSKNDYKPKLFSNQPNKLECK